MMNPMMFDMTAQGGKRRPGRRFTGLAVSLLFLLLLAACTRVAPLYNLKVASNSPDTTHDVLHMLDSLPDADLFARAFQRAGISSQLDPAQFFTLFVPTDSAMMAAGLTSAVIDTLSTDSLSRLLLYHITFGAVSDTSLIDAVVSVQQNCLLETLFYSQASNLYAQSGSSGYSSYQHSLFVKYYGGVLNINGWKVNAGETPVKAANGYLYPIHIVLRPPGLLLWNIVQSRPELSYYLAAIRFMDSITAGANNNNVPDGDSTIFSQIRFQPVAGSPENNNVTPIRPTVFAPTNTAFIAAGFPDIPTLQNYILNQIQFGRIYYVDSADCPSCYYPNNTPGQGYQRLSNGGLNGVFNYFPLDSVFKLHYLFGGTQAQASPGLSFANAICYSDLTGCPSINNGVLNATALYAPAMLQFSAGAGGVLNIRWNASGTDNAVIPEDSSQLQQARNFWALNGVIYESDRLFLAN